ncbi:MAG: cupin [Ilumatobacteraceae bacterium]|nr:cupin [Ilumatobacteraceae bacterium]
MSVRRVVTGHAPDGRSIVVSDTHLDGMPIGDRGSSAISLWGRDDPGQFPDDGSQPTTSAAFPPPGGCGIAVISLAPDGDDFHHFVGNVLKPWADPDDPGMHRTATLDYDLVLEGTVGLELDDGVEVTLGPGDLVVQNGTRHRWHNRGTTVARYMSVTVGAHNAVEGGRPVTGR